MISSLSVSEQHSESDGSTHLPPRRTRRLKISAAQLRQLLGYETRMEVDAFLKSHGVELEYTVEDIERDRETHRQLGL